MVFKSAAIIHFYLSMYLSSCLIISFYIGMFIYNLTTITTGYPEVSVVVVTMRYGAGRFGCYGNTFFPFFLSCFFYLCV